MMILVLALTMLLGSQASEASQDSTAIEVTGPSFRPFAGFSDVLHGSSSEKENMAFSMFEARVTPRLCSPIQAPVGMTKVGFTTDASGFTISGIQTLGAYLNMLSSVTFEACVGVEKYTITWLFVPVNTPAPDFETKGVTVYTVKTEDPLVLNDYAPKKKKASTPIGRTKNPLLRGSTKAPRALRTKAPKAPKGPTSAPKGPKTGSPCDGLTSCVAIDVSREVAKSKTKHTFTPFTKEFWSQLESAENMMVKKFEITVSPSLCTAIQYTRSAVKRVKLLPTTKSTLVAKGVGSFFSIQDYMKVLNTVTFEACGSENMYTVDWEFIPVTPVPDFDTKGVTVYTVRKTKK